MDRRSKLYLNYVLILLIGLGGWTMWQNNQTRDQINDLNASPPMYIDLGSVNIDFLNFISPDHRFWGVIDHETTSFDYRSNETHTWVTLTLDLTYNNFSYQAIGENRWIFDYVDTGNYTLIQEWNVEGNTTYEKGIWDIEDVWECDSALCEIDRLADKTYTLYIDIPTPLIVDQLNLDFEMEKLKNNLFLDRLVGIMVWFVFALGPLKLQGNWNE